MKPIEEWIRGFLKRYVHTIGPHDFPDGSDPDEVRCFVEGWVEAFSFPHPKVTEAEADAARLRLALHPPSFRRDHLPAVCAVVLGMRERDAAAKLSKALEASPAESRAAAESKDCPECGGGGLARRKGVWQDRSWSATAALYCRCPMGRHRLAEDVDDDPRAYDDLQAFPSLWDREKSHPTWSSRPTQPPSVEGRAWRYLAPGEPVPPPPVALARPPRRPGREDLGRVKPAVPIPPRPAPPTEPTPAVPAPEPDVMEWF